jgi:hypothetical protein
MRAGHLKPLGRPMQNARNWFATCELERLGKDVAWLDKATLRVFSHPDLGRGLFGLAGDVGTDQDSKSSAACGRRYAAEAGAERRGGGCCGCFFRFVEIRSTLGIAWVKKALSPRQR